MVLFIEGFRLGNTGNTIVNQLFASNRPYLEGELLYYEKSIGVKFSNVYYGQMIGDNLLIKGSFKLNR